VVLEFLGGHRLSICEEGSARVLTNLPRHLDAILAAIFLLGLVAGGIWGYEHGLQDAQQQRTAASAVRGAFGVTRRESDLDFALATLWPAATLIVEKAGPGFPQCCRVTATQE
jgi:hypothetical protein